MTTKKVRCTATVTLQLKVLDLGGWGESCPVSQVHKQAVENAIDRLRMKLQNERIQFVGEPVVDIITSNVE